MTESEKAAAFDVIAAAMAHCWSDGKWTWWPAAPCGGADRRDTPDEAVADFVAWCERIARRKRAIRSGGLAKW